ncbi:MAG: DUF2723 domain-containing protein [Bacteroidales bacterium]|nr:DUF2723 domain-containing protein [Bacteroidales bacterium]
MQFKFWNRLVGYMVFLVSAIVYVMTIEPSVSFWDCGEFISTSFRLEVGHPPGAPFFMLLGRMFTFFAGGDVSKVPVCINVFSALCSAATIWLLYLSITHLARKIAGGPEVCQPAQLLRILGSGIVGALAYTFSDTFWFSAVEGEVYACSSLFTALVFWAILKWEDEAGERLANRWLILIAYLMGLSIGVHLLNLLAIPAIVFVYYFKTHQVTRGGVFKTLCVSALILAGILYGIIPGVVQLAISADLFFVNTLHLPFSSGVVAYAVLLIGGLVWGLRYTLKNGKVLWNTILLCVTVILIGYSSYAVIVIRSAAELPMDLNDPQNIMNLQSYLNREQYGDRPLLRGAYYNAPILSMKDGRKIYAKGEKSYEVIARKQSYDYDKRFITWFPRMHSERHSAFYEDWVGPLSGRSIRVTQSDGTVGSVKRPTMAENLTFLLRYQLNFMYFRYFMWNFSGRQNDTPGDGNVLKGNWITGIPVLDEIRLGPQDIPDSMRNKGRNTYFMLPLLLGLLGLAFQYRKANYDFWVVFTLFFMTGVAIVLYLNQSPNEPRERDYAYAGSFYAFAIWIGLGVQALAESLPHRMQTAGWTAAAVLVLLLCVPVRMAAQNWDDHDRSGRYVARYLGYNYLMSCDENAVIFTYGDNDTYPLWYAQETEGVRTDVRVANLSFLSADWYIDQMRRKAYKSDPLPISIAREKYVYENRTMAYIFDLFNGEYVSVREAVDFLASDDKRTKTLPQYAETLDYLPARFLSLPVDRDKVFANGTVPAKDTADIVPEVKWRLAGNQEYGDNILLKSAMMTLDILATNNWTRPLYFAYSVPASHRLNLDAYMRLDGFAYRVVPVQDTVRKDWIGTMDTDLMYDRLMNVFRWENVNNPKVYLDETCTRTLGITCRHLFMNLAEMLSREGKHEKALEVLDRCMEVIPDETVPLDIYSRNIVSRYYEAGDITSGDRWMEVLAGRAVEEYNYLESFPRRFATLLSEEKRARLVLLNSMVEQAEQFNRTELSGKYGPTLERMISDWYASRPNK